MIIFFDTETTGLPIDWKAPVTDLENWPRLVEIAWIITDESGKRIHEHHSIIKPNGFEIPRQASDVHGITTEIAIEEGVELSEVLNEFQELLSSNQEILVAHNMSFDEKIIHAEFLRNNLKFPDCQKICTKDESTNFCKLPGPYGFKWPQLGELHRKLFGYDFNDAHSALIDTRVLVNCFFELIRRGIVKMNKKGA